MSMILSGATYDCRTEIKSVGGKFDGRVWTVTSEQLAKLQAMAASGRSLVKRDSAFARAWDRVIIGGSAAVDAAAQDAAEGSCGGTQIAEDMGDFSGGR